MKFLNHVTELRDALNKILTVIDKRNTRPVLANCLFNIKNGLLEIIATDLEVSAKTIINTESNDDFRFCINTKNFYDIIRELPDSKVEITIKSDENILKLDCKNISYSLLISDTSEYPQILFNNNNQFNLKSEDIVKIISRTSHAMSTDETRINLNGIFLQLNNGKLRSVAIDGHRLALIDLNGYELENNSLEDGIIIPRKGISELKKLADFYPEKDISVSLDDSFISFSVDNEYFLSIRLIAREYPKYQTVIPAKTTYSFLIDRNSLIDAIKRIKILSNEKTNGIKFSIGSEKLSISANHPSLGHAKEDLPINYDGNDIEIGFNAKYMVETLNVLDVNEVTFEFNNELSPVVIKSVEMQEFLGIVMPLKL